MHDASVGLAHRSRRLPRRDSVRASDPRMSTRALRQLRQLDAQLSITAAPAATAVDTSGQFLYYSPPDPERLPYCDPTTEAICGALRTDGCALLKAVIPPELALELGEKLRGYVPLPHEDGRDTGTDIGPNRRSRALCRPRDLSELPAHPAVGHRIQPAGFVPDCDWQGNITTLFQRDPAFLALVGPSPVREVMDEMLGDQCHLITMKGWRHGPGHGGNRQQPAAPGVHAGGFHCDEMWLPPDLPKELATQLGPHLSNTVHIIGTLTYLNGTTPECCPTRVIPGSFRSCRRPKPGETSWDGRGPVAAIASPGDTLLFRSDVWHAGGTNVTENTTRLTVEAAYGARKVSQVTIGSHAEMAFGSSTDFLKCI